MVNRRARPLYVDADVLLIPCLRLATNDESQHPSDAFQALGKIYTYGGVTGQQELWLHL